MEIVEADPATGVITAAGRFDQRNWAACPDPLMLVNDQAGTGHMVEAREHHREVELTASMMEAPQGAPLTLRPGVPDRAAQRGGDHRGVRHHGRSRTPDLEAVAGRA